MNMKSILVDQQNSVVRVRLNRPETRNAFHPEMITELTTTFKKTCKEKSVRAVVLSGEGKSFCSGADLGWMNSMAKFSGAQNRKDSEKLFEMFQSLRDCPVPLICKVQGHVMGGALGLVAASDLVVADEGTQFCFSEAKLGLAPAVISAFVKDKVNFSGMSRWFLTADVFSSADARDMGLVHAVRAGASIDAQVAAGVRSVL